MTALLRIAAAAALIATAAAAQAAPSDAAASADAAIAEARTSIPPNCLLDPWTHKYVCVKWPKKKKLAAIG